MLQRLLAWITGRRQLERLAAIEEKVGKFGRAVREDLDGQRRQLHSLKAQLSTVASADSLRALRRRVEDAHVSLAQQDRGFSDALERARLLDEQGVDDRRFARRVEQFLRHDRPIVVGPWTGEVGFELLYWIPFVRWSLRHYGIPRDRVFVVSRGGAEVWYGRIATRYADVFSFCSPDEFRAATEARKKQRLVGAFDREMVRRVMTAHDLGRAELLHPGMMYRLFMPFWKDLATMARVDAYTAHTRLDPVDDPVLRELPAEYVAARFYFSDCFPDTPPNRAFAAGAVDAISRQVPVVLLNTPFRVDDHRDVMVDGGRVITIAAQNMTPERNLAVQTAVIARARGFVGTYGGYSYLAPLCGVSSLAFYSARTFKAHHLHVAQRVFERLGGATVVPLDVNDVPLVRLAVAGAFAAVP